jgi:ArsR family transcriptional regulator, arsenate/arsenite/antimonite-responsive transcriptional repressor
LRHINFNMASAKIQLFNNELNNTAKVFKALGHPARLAILKYLAEAKTCITGDFADELPLSRSTVNQHLAELKETGLIKWHTEGVKTFYCLDYDKIQELKSISESFINQINQIENLKC